jgi:N-methylhydantoinase A
MERALRAVTLEKGEDPRFYTLLPFGGAGGLVAALLAERLGMKKILIPPYCGVLSALGMLVADFKKELVQSFLKIVSPGIRDELDLTFSKMSEQAEQILTGEGVTAPRVLKYIDMRYKGQSYELTVPYTDDFLIAFHQAHHQLYSYSLDDEYCEIVNLRVLAVGKSPGLKLEKRKKIPDDAKIFYRKEVYFNGKHQEFCIYRRFELMPGNRLIVPAIIAADDSTVIVPKGFEIDIDEYSNILLYKYRK